MNIYIQAKSKKAINEMIAEGKQVIGMNYSMFGGGGEYNLNDCPSGTTVSVYEKFVGGNPYAKSYGTWNGKKLV